MTEGGYDISDYQIYAATGTEDFDQDLIVTQVEEMWTRQPFSQDNLTLHISTGSSHDLLACCSRISVQYAPNVICQNKLKKPIQMNSLSVFVK